MRRLSGTLLLALILSNNLCVLAKPALDPEAKKKAEIDKIISTIEAEKPTPEEKVARKAKRKERLEGLGNFIAERLELPEAKRAEIKQKIAEHHSKSNSMPPEVREEIKRKLDVAGFTRRTTYTVLGDHFDDKDLKNIQKFLKSSTGAKLIKETPDMLLQTVVLTAEHFVPIIADFLKQVRGMRGLMPDSIKGGPNDPKRQEMIDQMKKLIEEQQRPRLQPAPEPSKNEI